MATDADILKVIQFGHQTFHLKVYNQNHREALMEYCAQMLQEGVANNSSILKLKMDVWTTDKWWIVVDKDTDKIVSVSGCHPLVEFESQCWRVMFRLGTLKSYRGRAAGLAKDQRNCFGWGVMLPYQIEYCRSMGAKKIVFTTNADSQGDPNSLRQDKICKLVFEKLNMAKLVDTRYLFNTYQNIWQVLIEDVHTKKVLVL